jgi:hypothetical protein
MDVDSKGFAHLGQNTVRKYDTKTGKLVGAIEHSPETEGGGAFQQEANLPNHVPGQGGAGPVVGFLPPPPGEGRGGRGGGRGGNVDPAARAAAIAAFRAKYPPTTPMIVGGIEEIRVDEAANEIYVADNYLNGRIMVFDLNTLKFKRGWGAYGHKLPDISTRDEDHAYKPNGPQPKEFAGHLTFNFSNDGLVYAADRIANRIHVTDKQGNFKKEIMRRMRCGRLDRRRGVLARREQRFLAISDLTNNHVWFLNRSDGKVVGTLGMGENGGQFFGLHDRHDSRAPSTGECSRARARSASCTDSPRGKFSISSPAPACKTSVHRVAGPTASVSPTGQDPPPCVALLLRHPTVANMDRSCLMGRSVRSPSPMPSICATASGTRMFDISGSPPPRGPAESGADFTWTRKGSG